MTYIAKQQWDEINENQKQKFQKGINANYEEGEYPSRIDLRKFLDKFSNYNSHQTAENGGEFRDHDDTDALWEKVRIILSSK